MRRLLTLFPVCLLLLLCSCGDSSTPREPPEPEKAISARMSTYQGVMILEGEEYADLFDEMLRSSVEHTLDDAPPLFYQVQLSYPEERKAEYVIFPDPVAESVYLIYQGHTYRAARQYAEQFLALDVMAPAYLDPVDYQLRITTPGGKATSFVSEYDFTYLVPSGWKSIHTDQEASLQSVCADDLSDVSLEFSQPPEEWSMRCVRAGDGFPVEEPGPGTYLCTVTASYTESTMGRYSGKIIFRFSLKLYGQPQLTLSSEEVAQGGLLALRIENTVPGVSYTLTGTHTKQALSFRETEQGLLALLPIDAEASPGPQTLFFGQSEQVEGDEVFTGSTVSFTILETDFPVQTDGDEAQLSRLSEVQDLTRAHLGEASGGDLLARVPFSFPTDGKVLLPFGSRIHSPESSHPVRSDGLELSADAVSAPASGTILCCETLSSGGDFILIDHGFGLVSCLAHLNSRTFSTGDSVSAGIKLGTMEEASGLPLHYAVYLGETPVDPNCLQDKEFWAFLLGNK